jgi:hypothetical protein
MDDGWEEAPDQVYDLPCESLFDEQNKENDLQVGTRRKLGYCDVMKHAESAVKAANGSEVLYEKLAGLFIAAQHLMTGKDPDQVKDCDFRDLIKDCCVMLPTRSGNRTKKHHTVSSATGTQVVLSVRGEQTPHAQLTIARPIQACAQAQLTTARPRQACAQLTAARPRQAYVHGRNSVLVPETVVAPMQGRPATKRKMSAAELGVQRAKKVRRQCKFCHDEKHNITTCPQFNKWGAKPRPEETTTISAKLADANDSTYPAVPLTASDYSQDKPRLSTIPAGTEWLCVHKKCYVRSSETLKSDDMCLIVTCLRKGGFVLGEPFERRAVEIQGVRDWLGKGKTSKLILDRMSLGIQESVSAFDAAASQLAGG